MTTPVINLMQTVAICFECEGKTTIIKPGEKIELNDTQVACLRANTQYIEGDDRATTTPDTSASQVESAICNAPSQTPTLTSTLPICNGGTMGSTTLQDILALIDNREVQVYPSLAGFPTTGEDNIIYKAEDTDLLYTRDTTTNAYVVYSGPNKSVLGDEVGSVPTVINVNTPIVVSTDPTQAGVLTNGTSIILPQIPVPFFVPVASTQIVTDGAIGVYTDGLPFIDFTYSNTSSRSQLIEFNTYGVIYTFLSPSATQYEVKYDNYTKFLSSLPDENGETLFNNGLGQQNIAPASLGGNIEQNYGFVFKKILNAGQSITFTLWSQIGNFSGLPVTNTVFSGIPGVTHKSFLVTPL